LHQKKLKSKITTEPQTKAERHRTIGAFQILIMNKYIKPILLVLLGLILGSILFSTCNKNLQAPPTVSKKEIVEQVKNVNAAETKANNTVDSLQKLINNASKHIAWLELNSNAADNTIALLRNKVAILGKKSIIITTPQADKEVREDLLFEVENLNAATDLRDSLCDATVSELKQVSSTKDSIISNQKTAYSFLKMAYDTSVANNLKQIDFSKYQKKQIRKEKAKAWIWKGAIIGLGYLILKK
jgi:hypothetical protein